MDPKKTTLLFLAFLSIPCNGQTENYVPLKDVVANLSSGYDVRMGGIASYLLGDEEYDDTLCRNMDFLTAENQCKWGYAEPEYYGCTNTLEFAESCNMDFRYHVLIYGAEEQNPEWLQPSSPEYGDWTPEEKRQIIIDHVTEVVTMYKGRIKYYDVVNEAICDCVGWPGSPYANCEEYMTSEEGAVEKCGFSERYNTYLKRNVFWPDVEDYIGLSLSTAREADPDAILGVNEYAYESSVGYGDNGGYVREKGICMYNLTKALKDDGVPIDYVGAQTHIDLGWLNFEGYIDSVKAYSQDITQLGVQWHFTEVTVRTLDEGDSEFMTEEEQLDQAELYSGLMQACIDLGPDTCITFQTWGHSDRYTNWEQIDGKKPFLFDYINNPKLSYYSVVEALHNTEG